MDIIRDINAVNPLENTAVTVGTFDGIHLGHQKIISRLVESAKSLNGKSVAVTFDPHPKEVIILPDKPPITILSTTAEKLDVLAEHGVDIVVIIEFTKEFSKTPPDVFAKEILAGILGARSVVVGYDHSFGRDRKGNTAMLLDIGESAGFTVDDVGPYKVDGVAVSSTLIRRKLLEGNIDTTTNYLGRYYSISGRVIKGKGIGKQMNFPTANIEIPRKNKVIPKNGVYCIRTEIEGEPFTGMMNIGLRPTYNGDSRTVEAHIFSGDEIDLYDTELNVELISRIRDERKFESPEELVAQLVRDKELCFKI